jgi:hypothetical protein
MRAAMPDRIIRDELMRSHRYRTLSSDTTRLLFVHLLLSVDNLGNHEATTTAVSDVIRRHIDEPTLAKLLAELADADLIRMYQVDAKPYLHIPRFRQRLRYLGSKHPRPPANIECSEISSLLKKVGTKTVHSHDKDRTQPLEVKRSEVLQTLARTRTRAPVDNSATASSNPTPQPDGDKSPKGNGNQPPRPARGGSDQKGIEALARYFGHWPLQGEAGRDWGVACELVNRLRAEHFRASKETA